MLTGCTCRLARGTGRRNGRNAAFAVEGCARATAWWSRPLTANGAAHESPIWTIIFCASTETEDWTLAWGRLVAGAKVGALARKTEPQGCEHTGCALALWELGPFCARTTQCWSECERRACCRASPSFPTRLPPWPAIVSMERIQRRRVLPSALRAWRRRALGDLRLRAGRVS